MMMAVMTAMRPFGAWLGRGRRIRTDGLLEVRKSLLGALQVTGLQLLAERLESLCRGTVVVGGLGAGILRQLLIRALGAAQIPRLQVLRELSEVTAALLCGAGGSSGAG